MLTTDLGLIKGTVLICWKYFISSVSVSNDHVVKCVQQWHGNRGRQSDAITNKSGCVSLFKCFSPFNLSPSLLGYWMPGNLYSSALPCFLWCTIMCVCIYYHMRGGSWLGVSVMWIRYVCVWVCGSIVTHDLCNSGVSPSVFSCSSKAAIRRPM